MVDFQVYDYQGKRVLVFEVSGRPIGLPIQFDGVAWWYEGDSLVPMPVEVRQRIYAEEGFDFTSSVCITANEDDLDIACIEEFRKQWVQKSGNN